MIAETIGQLYDYCCSYFCHKTAIVYGGKRYTYNDLRENGLRLGNSLLKLGICKGDKVGVFLPNCPEFIFVDYALSKTGIVRIRLATFHEGEDLISMLEETEARALIYDEKFLSRVEKVRQALPQLSLICATNNKSSIPTGDHHLQTLIAEGSGEEIKAPVQGDDLYVIFYTSGTTGKPIGVLRSHRRFVALIMRILLDCDIEADEVYLAVTPLSHASGSVVVPVYLKGGSCVILPRFDPTQFFETVEQEKITLSVVVPTVIYALLDHPNVKKYDVGSLRNIIYGGAPINPGRLEEAIKMFGPIFTQTYGATEAPMPLTVLHRNETVIEGDEKAQVRLLSCGRPSFTTQLKLVDEGGKEVPKGEIGEIAVKNASVMLGYLNRPALNAETIKDGWVYTGDLARQDENGYIYLVERKKNKIISGGFNIYPKEIENVLLEHPAVAMAVVIGIPHPKWGEAVKAVVVTKAGHLTTEEELIGLCKKRKGGTIAPKSIDFVDSIPLTPYGKIDRKAVREKYWKGEKRRIA